MPGAQFQRYIFFKNDFDYSWTTLYILSTVTGMKILQENLGRIVFFNSVNTGCCA